MFSKILKYLNNLNVRQVLILAGASAVLMFAVIYIFFATYTAKEELYPASDNTSQEKPSLIAVVVAKSDISPRVKIREEMLDVKEMPKKDVPSGAITDKAEIIDLPAKITILAGDVITSRKLYKSTEQSGFVGTIPPDCRAISIRVNDITGVAGFAKPGDYVDLLLVENDSTSSTTNIILQNVLLLSINQTMNRDDVETGGEKNANTAIANPSIVTLALRPHEALKLVSASKLGDIYLMLRPARPLDMYVEGMEYKVISANAPLHEPKPQEEPKPVAPASAEPVSSPEPAKKEELIEIIQGDEFVQKTTSEDNKNQSTGNNKKN